MWRKVFILPTNGGIFDQSVSREGIFILIGQNTEENQD
jgi:hypothetical protein